MIPQEKHQPLARRLLGHYLMFGLASIVALSMGWFLVLATMPRDVHDHFQRISEVQSSILADQINNAGLGTQTLIHELSAEEWVAYAGVIAQDGKIIAHSKPARVGQLELQRVVGSGPISLVERHDPSNDGKLLREYWAELASGEKGFGSLQVGAVTGSNAGWLSRLSDHSPITIVVPLLFLIVGAGFMRASIQTSSVIEDQLCAVSSVATPTEFELRPLKEPSPAARGWNRLIQRAVGDGPMPKLHEKISASIGSQHEKRAERILQSLADGVALTDKDGHLTYANRAFGVLLRNAADATKMRGKPICDLFPPQANLQMTVSHESRPVVFEILMGDDISDGVLRIGRAPLPSEENTASQQHVWTVRDITQQKLSDQMRNDFLYSATHELRTPLTNIKAYAETLSLNEITDPEQQKSFLNVIDSEATRLARFVEELLNVSQMEAGSLTLNRSHIDTERLLLEIADKVRPQMSQKGITLEVAIPAKLPKLDVDKDKFTAALVNLLGNAAKYTPENGRVIFKITAGAKDMQIAVEDTGIGISEEDIPKLFKKFFRSADARVRDLPGSGLGLAFSQEVIRLHGGKVNVHSELNKGSQFILTIPLT